MSKPDTLKREIEHHIIRTVRKLPEPALLALLAELRNLTRSPAPAQEART